MNAKREEVHVDLLNNQYHAHTCSCSNCILLCKDTTSYEYIIDVLIFVFTQRMKGADVCGMATKKIKPFKFRPTFCLI